MGGELNVKDISNKYWEKGIGTGIDFWLVKGIGIGIDFPAKNELELEYIERNGPHHWTWTLSYIPGFCLGEL